MNMQGNGNQPKGPGGGLLFCCCLHASESRQPIGVIEFLLCFPPQEPFSQKKFKNMYIFVTETRGRRCRIDACTPLLSVSTSTLSLSPDNWADPGQSDLLWGIDGDPHPIPHLGAPDIPLRSKCIVTFKSLSHFASLPRAENC